MNGIFVPVLNALRKNEKSFYMKYPFFALLNARVA